MRIVKTTVKILYNSILIISLPLLFPAGYIISKLKKESKDYSERFGNIKISISPDRSIWFHSASVGEIRSLRPLITAIKETYPGLAIIISTTTYSGKMVAIKELKPEMAFLLPIENTLSITRIIKKLNCKGLFIVDTELWPNLIDTASKYCKLYLLNARLSDSSMKNYLRFYRIFRPLISKFDLILAKSEKDREKFIALGGSSINIKTLGNLKFYDLKQNIDQNITSRFQGKKVFFAASIHHGEDELIINAYCKVKNSFDYLIIAPRHLRDIEHITTILNRKGITNAKYSDKNFGMDCILVDTYGKLESFYSISHKIFIGGSYVKVGGHNVFEALKYKKTVIAGPYVHNFEEMFHLAKKYNLVHTVNSEKLLISYLENNRKANPNFDSFFEEASSTSDNKLSEIMELVKTLSAKEVT